MVKAHESWPCPPHVARPSLYLNGACTLPDPGLCGHLAYLNPRPSTCTFPAVGAFPGFTAPATPDLQTDQVQRMLRDPKTEPCLKEARNNGAMQNANPAPLQKKFIIVDQSGNKTRLFYSPIFPLVQSPIVSTKQFAQAYDVNQERQATNFGQKHLPKCSLPEESDQDHVVNEESEMHEDTEEINALLCSDDYDSDDDEDEVTSTDHSPLANEKTYLIQEQIEDTKEDVASSDWPSKRHKLIGGGYTARVPPPVDSASSLRLNEPCECVSDAESKYSGGEMYFARQTEEHNSAVGDTDTQLKKDKIRQTLRILESLTPGAKGKHPLLVIDETIDYLKSLMSQSGMLGVKYH